jgi:hypothetical protein
MTINLTFRKAYLENCLYADCEGHLWYEVQVVVEESRVRNDCIIRQRLHPCAACQTGSRLVERDMSVCTNASQEELNAAHCLDLRFIGCALSLEVWGISVEYVNVGRQDVDVREEVVEHEGVVAFWMITVESDVLVLADVNGCARALVWMSAPY